MAAANPKIVLNGSRDIPFNKLVLSQSNVRRTKAGVSTDTLAEDIGRRGLLQNLNASTDDSWLETYLGGERGALMRYFAHGHRRR